MLLQYKKNWLCLSVSLESFLGQWANGIYSSVTTRDGQQSKKLIVNKRGSISIIIVESVAAVCNRKRCFNAY